MCVGIGGWWLFLGNDWPLKLLQSYTYLLTSSYWLSFCVPNLVLPIRLGPFLHTLPKVKKVACQPAPSMHSSLAGARKMFRITLNPHSVCPGGRWLLESLCIRKSPTSRPWFEETSK